MLLRKLFTWCATGLPSSPKVCHTNLFPCGGIALDQAELQGQWARNQAQQITGTRSLLLESVRDKAQGEKAKAPSFHLQSLQAELESVEEARRCRGGSANLGKFLGPFTAVLAGVVRDGGPGGHLAIEATRREARGRTERVKEFSDLAGPSAGVVNPPEIGKEQADLFTHLDRADPIRIRNAASTSGFCHAHASLSRIPSRPPSGKGRNEPYPFVG
jgi:hypothetical protein